MPKYNNYKINKLINVAKSDTKGSEQAKIKIINIFTPAIYSYCERVGVIRNHQDYVQSGILGLMMAITTYDPKKSSFSTWSWYHIRKKILEEKALEHSVKISTHFLKQGRVLEFSELDDVQEYKQDNEQLNDQVQDIFRFLSKKLSKEEITIFLAYYWDNKKLSDLSKIYKVQARSVIHKIMVMLRDKYVI